MIRLAVIGVLALSVSCADKSGFKGSSSQAPARSGANTSGSSPTKDGTAANGSDAKLGGADGTNPIAAGDQSQLGPNGSTIGGGSGTLSASSTAADVQRTCASATLKKLQKKLFFPARRDCQWKENGNLGRDNGRMQARESQKLSLALPGKIVLCELSMKSAETNFEYDDSILLTLGQTILLHSTDALTAILPSSGGLYQWDWDSLKGKQYNFEGKPYCLGGESQCKIPTTETVGAVSLDFDTKALAPLAVKLLGTQSLDFTMIATGDNDDGDCRHTDITFDVSISYVSE